MTTVLAGGEVPPGDIEAIEQVSLDYVEGYTRGDADCE